MRLITPKRLRENEEFMWRLADRQLDTFLSEGRCEYISQFAAPFAMLVVADLLGVPEEDHQRFADALLHGHSGTGAVGSTGQTELAHTPLEYLYHRFTEYVEERRTTPQADVLTGLATATFPDGSIPDVLDVVRIAANLFAAGQETTVRLLSFRGQAHRRGSRSPGPAPRRPWADPELHRRDAAHGEPGQGGLSGCPGCRPPWAEWIFPPAPP